MASDTIIDEITRPAKTASYQPHIMGNRLGQVLDGRPRFSWLEAERMRLDPQIQFGLRILRAPLWGVTVKVSADKASVESWVTRQFAAVYNHLLTHLCRSFEYGVACGEVTFRAKRLNGKTRIHFHDFLELHPRDAKPLVYDRGSLSGKLAGLHVTGCSGGSGSMYLDRRHSFWFKGEAEFGSWWGRPRLAGPHEPWLEKRGKGGAIDSRRLWYKKGAFRGPSMRYPIGRVNVGDDANPVYVSNQDLARELVEKFENGGVLALPNVKAQNGGDYLWTWEDPKSFSDAAGFLEYPKQLDREILIGFGIPPELVDAATVGSGYSGRAIPAQMFFSMMDEIAGLMVKAITEQIIRPLVQLNFGACSFEIKPDSLAQLIAKSADGQGGQGGQGGEKPPAQGQGSGTVPYQGPHGGIGQKDMRTGKVSYGKPKVRLSLADAARQDRRAKRRERLRMSWTYSEGPKGGHRWVSDNGEVRYQKEKPADDDAGKAGPESVFDHPDVVARGFHPEEKRYSSPKDIRAKYHQLAVDSGVDPTELHRDVANQLEYAAHNWAGRSTGPINRNAELASEYAFRLGQHQESVANKRAAAKFADNYFDQDSSAKRANAYLKAVEAGSATLDPEHLDEDARAAIVEDLAALPPAKLAAHLAHVIEQYGTDDDSRKATAWQIIDAATKAVPDVPAKFNGAKPDGYSVVSADDLDTLSDTDRAAIESVHRLSPGTKLPGGGVLVPKGSPLEKAIEAVGLSGEELGDEDGMQKVFDGIADHPQLAQASVPASAKNFGTTSGALAPDAAPDDWNPNAVDTYKRIDKDGQWYMLKRGEHSAGDDGETYSIVPRKAIPPLSRLPDVYWNDLDTAPGTRDELVEGAEKKAEKATPEGAKDKRDLKGNLKARDITKLVANYKGEHARTGNLVRSDEALQDRVRGWAGNYTFGPEDATDPDDKPATETLGNLEDALKDIYEHAHDHEYDPDAIDLDFDGSQLSDRHDSRADHAELSRDTEKELFDWEDKTSGEVRAARDRAREQSQEFRDGLREKLQAVRQAAQAVLSLPSGRVSEDARNAAAEMNRGALKTLGRLQRKVKLSLAASKLWDASPEPILVEAT